MYVVPVCFRFCMNAGDPLGFVQMGRLVPFCLPSFAIFSVFRSKGKRQLEDVVVVMALRGSCVRKARGQEQSARTLLWRHRGRVSALIYV
jgi:hypothetical protein